MAKVYTKRDELARKAVQLKKSSIILSALLGDPNFDRPSTFVIEDYRQSKKDDLIKFVENLESELRRIMYQLFPELGRSRFWSSMAWFEEKFNEWDVNGYNELFEIGRVHELEARLGRMAYMRGKIDCPPYAQVILQGFFGAAVRHPEYHLAKDVALLYNLFLDATDIIDQQLNQKIVHSTEHVQSLGRSVIVTCFNLLESFVSGLSTAYLLEAKHLPDEVRAELSNRRLPLRTRLSRIPNKILGDPAFVDMNKPPFMELFGPCKQQRDSFVHCEPGPSAPESGPSKEQLFHDITTNGVRRTVDLTLQAICFIWQGIHGKPKPTWLPLLKETGRFGEAGIELRIALPVD